MLDHIKIGSGVEYIKDVWCIGMTSYFRSAKPTKVDSVTYLGVVYERLGGNRDIPNVGSKALDFEKAEKDYNHMIEQRDLFLGLLNDAVVREGKIIQMMKKDHVIHIYHRQNVDTYKSNSNQGHAHIKAVYDRYVKERDEYMLALHALVVKNPKFADGEVSQAAAGAVPSGERQPQDAEAGVGGEGAEAQRAAAVVAKTIVENAITQHNRQPAAEGAASGAHGAHAEGGAPERGEQMQKRGKKSDAWHSEDDGEEEEDGGEEEDSTESEEDEHRDHAARVRRVSAQPAQAAHDEESGRGLSDDGDNETQLRKDIETALGDFVQDNYGGDIVAAVGDLRKFAQAVLGDLNATTIDDGLKTFESHRKFMNSLRHQFTPEFKIIDTKAILAGALKLQQDYEQCQQALGKSQGAVRIAKDRLNTSEQALQKAQLDIGHIAAFVGGNRDNVVAKVMSFNAQVKTLLENAPIHFKTPQGIVDVAEWRRIYDQQFDFILYVQPFFGTSVAGIPALTKAWDVHVSLVDALLACCGKVHEHCDLRRAVGLVQHLVDSMTATPAVVSLEDDLRKEIRRLEDEVHDADRDKQDLYAQIKAKDDLITAYSFGSHTAPPAPGGRKYDHQLSSLLSGLHRLLDLHRARHPRPASIEMLDRIDTLIRSCFSDIDRPVFITTLMQSLAEQMRWHVTIRRDTSPHGLFEDGDSGHGPDDDGNDGDGGHVLRGASHSRGAEHASRSDHPGPEHALFRPHSPRAELHDARTLDVSRGGGSVSRTHGASRTHGSRARHVPQRGGTDDEAKHSDSGDDKSTGTKGRARQTMPMNWRTFSQYSSDDEEMPKKMSKQKVTAIREPRAHDEKSNSRDKSSISPELSDIRRDADEHDAGTRDQHTAASRVTHLRLSDHEASSKRSAGEIPTSEKQAAHEHRQAGAEDGGRRDGPSDPARAGRAPDTPANRIPHTDGPPKPVITPRDEKPAQAVTEPKRMVHAPAAVDVPIEPMKAAAPVDDLHQKGEGNKVEVPKASASVPSPSKGGDKEQKKKEEGSGFRAGFKKLFGGGSDPAQADYDGILSLEPTHDSD